ncbi:ROK family protein [Streptomyces sp. NPDC058372]|uniref:ROK family transcriptional regulator n=1 Tax=Streptomyces sp. NPDC058372 TaxID=3346464 RepID=UPI0036534EDE
MVAGTPRVLRVMNERAALELLTEHGALSRARLGALTGLSKPTVSQLLARLEAAGLVGPAGTDEGRPGPGARLYALRGEVAYVAALDVRPGRIRAAVADVTGTVLATHTLATPARPGPGGVAAQLTEALDGASDAAGVARAALRRVVVGTPGAFDPRTGRLRYAGHLAGWHSPGLLPEVAAALHPVPVEYENDVNLAAVAERRLGAARGHEDFVLLWNGTGLGAALVIGGRLHRGWTGGAGEIGFLPVAGTPLVRGVARSGSGGFQQLAGAQALAGLARELGVPVPEVPEGPDGGGPDGEAVAAALLRAAAEAYARPGGGPVPGGAGGDPAPEAFSVHVGPAALLRAYAVRLATGIASLVAVLDPAVIVLTGRVLAAGGEPLLRMTEEELAELAPSRPRLLAGEVTGDPVVRGGLEVALAAVRDEVFDTGAL